MKSITIISVLATCLLIFVPMLKLIAQADTLVCYDCRTKQIEIIPPQPVTSTKEFDYTEWNLGQASGKTDLDTSNPQNTLPGSGFTDLISAKTLFDVSRYPIRTIVKIFRYVNDTLEHWNTGTLVAPNLVITCAHSPYYYGERTFEDSLLIIPAYDDDNKDHPLFGTSISKKYYIPKTFYENKKMFDEWDDIALIELYEPIGQQTGWMGISFNLNSDFFRQKVFHKLSYPRPDDPRYPNKYNGYTLYYNKGLLDKITPIRLGYFSDGIIGQSGSPFFYTDNNREYSVVALGSHSKLCTIVNGILYCEEGFFHVRLTKSMFYALKSIIDKNNNTVGTQEFFKPLTFSLEQNYPNPFNPVTKIKYNLHKSSDVVLTIYNLSGQELQILLNKFQVAGEYEITWYPNGLPSGIYFYRLQAGEFSETKKLILQK